MKKVLVFLLAVCSALIVVACGSKYGICEYCYENDATIEYKAGGSRIYVCDECDSFYGLWNIYD